MSPEYYSPPFFIPAYELCGFVDTLFFPRRAPYIDDKPSFHTGSRNHFDSREYCFNHAGTIQDFQNDSIAYARA